jgi:hypothetical protein
LIATVIGSGRPARRPACSAMSRMDAVSGACLGGSMKI